MSEKTILSYLVHDEGYDSISNKGDAQALISALNANQIADCARVVASTRTAYGALARWARAVAILARDEASRAEAETAIKAVLDNLRGTENNGPRTVFRRAVNTALAAYRLRLVPRGQGRIGPVPAQKPEQGTKVGMGTEPMPIPAQPEPEPLPANGSTTAPSRGLAETEAALFGQLEKLAEQTSAAHVAALLDEWARTFAVRAQHEAKAKATKANRKGRAV